MYAAAIDFRPKLLARARNLCPCLADAEDLVQDAYVVFTAKPPEPRTPSELHNWLRVVMSNQRARQFREFHGATVGSYEAIQEARERRALE